MCLCVCVCVRRHEYCHVNFAMFVNEKSVFYPERITWLRFGIFILCLISVKSTLYDVSFFYSMRVFVTLFIFLL